MQFKYFLRGHSKVSRVPGPGGLKRVKGSTYLHSELKPEELADPVSRALSSDPQACVSSCDLPFSMGLTLRLVPF